MADLGNAADANRPSPTSASTSASISPTCCTAWCRCSTKCSPTPSKRSTGNSATLPTMLRFGTWVGGDMDGNPNVGADTIAAALDAQRAQILANYRQDVRGLASILTQTRDRIGIDEAVDARIAQILARLPEAEPANPRQADMPYRQLLELIELRLRATARNAAAPRGVMTPAMPMSRPSSMTSPSSTQASCATAASMRDGSRCAASCTARARSGSISPRSTCARIRRCTTRRWLRCSAIAGWAARRRRATRRAPACADRRRGACASGRRRRGLDARRVPHRARRAPSPRQPRDRPVHHQHEPQRRRCAGGAGAGAHRRMHRGRRCRCRPGAARRRAAVRNRRRPARPRPK